MFGQSDSGGGAVVDDDKLLVDAFADEPMPLCSMFWFEAVDVEFWETPATAAAATANADKIFLFFLLRFLAEEVFPIGSTHITCYVWFFYVLLDSRAFFCQNANINHNKQI